MSEMHDLPRRRRRWRTAALALATLAILSISGGVYAAGGLGAIYNWFQGVDTVEVHPSADGGPPTIILTNEEGDVIGAGRLAGPDANGDYPAVLMPAGSNEK